MTEHPDLRTGKKRFGALKIAGLYLVAGSLWILFSDQLAAMLSFNQEMFTRISMYKGWGYVLVTAVLLHYLILRYTASLEDSEVQLRAIFESSRDAIGVSRAGIHYLVNPSYVEMFGYEQAGQLVGTPIINLIAPESREFVKENIQRRLAGENAPFSYEVTALRRDGSRFLMEVRASLYTLHREQYTLVMLRDVTELKQAIERLHLQSAALEAAANAIVITDKNGRIEWTNPAFGQLTGYTIEEANGKNPRELVFSGQQSGAYYKKLWQTITDGQVWHNWLVNRRKDGSLYDEEMTITPLRNEAGEITHFIAIKQDVTERRRNERAVQQYAVELERRVEARTAALTHANLELERANRAKDEFLANMSHELRTPLNGILGLSESLLLGVHEALTNRQKKSVEAIESSGRHLLGLINDILDLSKIEAGKLDVYREAVYVRDVCQSSLAFIRQAALKKSIQVEYASEPVEVVVEADPRRLKQILVNLLSNAVKFTPANGQVKLEVRVEPEAGRLDISVTDTGIGIAPEDLKRLFNPFTQIDSSLTRRFEGTGLGLALVKRLTEMQGGTVQVESQEGQGSKFTVSLPWRADLRLAGAEQPGSRQAEPEPGQAGSTPETPEIILLAEDSEINVMTISDYLEARGYQVVVANDGQQAIELARQFAPGLILMDIQMPVMDGFEAIRRLRADARFARTPIIALTALAMPGDEEKCLAAGADEYMSKPVSLQKLAKTVDQVFGRKN